jgi:hypothetical protein
MRRVRLAIMVAVGISAFAIAPSAYAISGSAGQRGAALNEYEAPSQDQPVIAVLPEETPPEQTVLPETPQESGTPEPQARAVLPTTAAPSAPVDLTDEGGLPLTGFILLQVVLAGVLSLTAGLALRRFANRRL